MSFEPAPGDQGGAALAADPRADVQDRAALGGGERGRLAGGPESHQAGRAGLDDGALRAGAIDVALTFVYDYVPAEPDPALDTEPLLEEPVYLATPAGPRGTAETGIQHWRDAPWIAGSPDTLCHTMVIRACQACGFTPRIRHHADDFATVLALVAAGQGVSLIPRLGVTGTPPGITLTPLAARRRTSIACRKGTRHHPAISAFATAIREHAGPPAAGQGRWVS